MSKILQREGSYLISYLISIYMDYVNSTII